MLELADRHTGTARNQKNPVVAGDSQIMSEGSDWNTVSKHRKENVGQMANGGGRDVRREKMAGPLGQRRASKQDANRAPRPQPSVSSLPEL